MAAPLLKWAGVELNYRPHAYQLSLGDPSIGPDLTGRRYPDEYLAKVLAHPDSVQLTQTVRPGPFRMPTLGLTQQEIASLVAMINGGPQVSADRR